jgi:GNAT superfamily N-acetyltransferase
VTLPAEIVPRLPSVEEFAALKASVGFKPHPPEAIRIGLANSWFGVCAIVDGVVVGTGRIVGDGALHFSVTNIMVAPSHQRRGIGAAIVEALMIRLRQVEFENVLVEVSPLPGLEAFYARFGFEASRRYAPCMNLWLNPSTN